jgi:nucleotide-binding universal stress UspA family protein
LQVESLAHLVKRFAGHIDVKRILLATDGSSHADAAVRFLSRFPCGQKLDVTVLTVVQQATDRFLTRSPEQLFAAEEAAANETFLKVESMLRDMDAAVRHELRVGHPGEIIVKTAEELEAECIVLGARGRSRIRCMLLGCTSDYVATQANCSVMVIRSDESRDADHPLRIAIAYDGSLPANAAMKEFGDIAWGSNVEVHLISILCCFYGFFGEIPLDSEQESDLERTKLARAALNDALTALHEVTPTAQAHLIPHEHIGDGLVKFAKDHQCDLVMVGETPLSSFRRALPGGVSRFVLRHSPCSVWIARNHMRPHD